MRNARRRTLAALCFFLLVASGIAEPAPAGGEELAVQAQVDKMEVAQGEGVTFSVTISGVARGSPELELGKLEGFRVVSTGKSQEIQVKGGRMMQRFVLTYTLAATAPGTHTIGPVRVKHKGEVYTTEPIEIKVTEGPAAPRRPKLEGGITL